MVNVFDVDAGKFIDLLKEEMKKLDSLKAPEWSGFVKTGVHTQRVPTQDDFWQIRAASMLRSLYVHGPTGVQKLRTKYGGRKDRGVRKEKTFKGAGHIIRTLFQQLEKEGMVEKIMQNGKKGRKLTNKAVKLLDNTAFKVYKSE